MSSQSTMPSSSANLGLKIRQQLLEARLWVARLGETSLLNWWRTEDILGGDGAFVGPRVLPKTHPVGRARIAFAAASHACYMRYKDDRALHLFKLDAWAEDAFDSYIHNATQDISQWHNVMAKLESLEGAIDPVPVLLEQGIISEQSLKRVRGLSLGPDSRSLRLPQSESKSELIELMVAGFTRGSYGKLVVPYTYEQELSGDD